MTTRRRGIRRKLLKQFSKLLEYLVLAEEQCTYSR